MPRRGRQQTALRTGRVVPVVALSGAAAPAACAVAGSLAAALTRLPGPHVELLVVPGTPAPPAPRGVPVHTGGLSAVLDRDDDARLVVCALPPRDLPRLRVTCPDCVAVLVVPPSLPAAQAAAGLIDQSLSWARRTVLAPQLPAPAMARAVLHVAAAGAAGSVALPGAVTPRRLRSTAAELARLVLTPPTPTWPGCATPALEEELVSCTA